MKKPFLSVISLILCFAVLLSAAGFSAGAQSTAMTGTVSQNAEVLLFEPYGGTSLFAYTDGGTHVLSADGARSCTTSYPGSYAFLCGSSVRVVCDLDGFLGVQCFSASSLSETDFYGVQIDAGDIHFLAADSTGRLYAVLYSAPNTVAVFDAAGSSIGSIDYDENVQGIQTLGSTLYVFLRSRCDRVALGGGLPQSSGNAFGYAASARPFRMLNSSTYITSSGEILTTGGAALLSTGQSIRSRHLLSADGSLLYWSSGSTVSRLNSGDGTRASLQLSGTVEAISASAAVIRKNNAFYLETYGSFIPAATPTPTPTAAPTASPAPADPESAGISFSGVYLYAPAGTTAAALRSTLSDSSAQIRTTDNQTASGKLRTGWTVTTGGKTYTIIVPGDINGSGTVNTADLRLLQAFLAGDKTPADTERLAADLSKNDSIDAADLVLLVGSLAQ